MEKNNKIYLPIFGGLGNQLFIYALGRALIEKHHKEIIFDTSFYKDDNFILEIEDLKVPYFKKTKHIFKIDFKYIKYLQLFPNFLKKIFINFLSGGIIKDIDFEKNIQLGNLGLKPFLGYNSEIFSNKKNQNYYYGHWQSKFYFDNIKKILQEDFLPKKKITEKVDTINLPNIGSNNIMLHIRGDNFGGMSDMYMEAVTDEYYLNSINFFKDKYVDPFFLIFSDDILFAKKTLSKIDKKINHKFINDYKLNSVEEFYLMTKFRNFIIPKSTFSWWAAYLAIEKNKIILIPDNWFISKKDNTDQVTEEMIQISYK